MADPQHRDSGTSRQVKVLGMIALILALLVVVVLLVGVGHGGGLGMYGPG